MIDLHNHIVPGVDDGSKSIQMSLDMLEEGLKQGIDGYIMTPHYNRGKYDNELVEEAFQSLKEAVKEAKMPIKVSLGNELYLNEENVSDMISGKAYTLGNSSYVLVELPFTQFYPFHETQIYKLQLAGFKVILAHIERYHYFVKRPELLADLLERGIYGQLSAKCISDKSTRKLAFDWIDQGYVQMIATDAHNTTSRPINAQKAYEVIVKHYGEPAAQGLFTGNPGLVLEDTELIKMTYKRKPIWKRMMP